MFNRPTEQDCGGFDIVIGNPPYVSAPTQINNKFLSLQRQKIINSNRYKTLYQKWDIYIVFMEIGINLLRTNGILSMIVPYPLTNQLYAKILRNMIIEETNFFELVDLNGTKIFDNATVSNCIPFIQKSNPRQTVWISNINDDSEINKIFEQPLSGLVQDEKTLVWNLTAEKRDTTRHANMNVLGDFCYISVGMVLQSDEKIAKGEFKKEDLISNVKDEIHPREYIEAKDISKYNTNKIRYLEWGTNRCPNKIRRKTFPEMYEHPKLIMNCLGTINSTFDDKNLVFNHSLYCALLWKDLQGVENKSISNSVKKFSKLSRQEMEKLSATVDLKYLLGIMNSKYASVLLTNIRGGDYHIYPEHIRNIPIPSATLAQQKPIIALVDKILAAKQPPKQVRGDTVVADTSELEKQIDVLVYKLYGLSAEEIKFIENNAKA